MGQMVVRTSDFKVGQNCDLNAAPPEIKQAFDRSTANGKSLVVTLGKKATSEDGKGWYSAIDGAFGVHDCDRAVGRLLLPWWDIFCIGESCAICCNDRMLRNVNHW
jgi:hypothetical protein